MAFRALILIFSCISASAVAFARYEPNDINALRATPKFHFFDASDKTKIAYSVFESASEGPSRGPLVFVQGKGESAYRYVEIVREMQKKGWGPIYVLDHRGQGYSEKAVKGAVHVENFDTYVKDFIKFMDGPVKTDLARRGIQAKPNIVAHSMGGAVTELALRQRPDLINRPPAYIAPMFDIHLTPFLDRVQNKPVSFLTSTLRGMGLGEISLGSDVQTAPGRLRSTDLARLQSAYKIEREMGIRVPKTTISWIDESLKAVDEIQQLAPDRRNSSIIFRGAYDRVISNPALLDYACSTPSCTLVEFSGAHALHQEREPVRRLLADQIDAHFRGQEIPDAPLDCQKFYKVLSRGK